MLKHGKSSMDISYLNKARERLLMLSGERKLIEARTKQSKQRLDAAVAELELAIEHQRIVHEISNATLDGLSIKINDIVSNAIKAIIPDPYEFDLSFEIKYNKLATRMRLIRDGKEFLPEDDNGDGVVDIVAFALRVAVICLDRRKLRKLLIMDEPFGALSVNYHAMAGKLLRYIKDNLKFQFVIIASHGGAYAPCADKMIESSNFNYGANL